MFSTINTLPLDRSSFDETVLNSVELTEEQCRTNKLALAIYLKIQRDSQLTYDSKERTIDAIIQNRRDELASSFGNKYFKDKMDTTDSDLVWASCFIPRGFTAPLYAAGKNNGLGGLVYVVNPINWIRGVLGSVARHAVPITPRTRKKQAIRTLIEGFEEKPIRDFQDQRAFYAAVYDTNKENTIGVFHQKLILEFETDEKGVSYQKFFFNGSEEEKKTFIEQMEILKDEACDLHPNTSEKYWFKRFVKTLEEVKTMPSKHKHIALTPHISTGNV